MATAAAQGKYKQSEDRLISASRIIPRPEHNISRADISDYALKVLYRLQNAGYQAYLVGGGVRDLLLGREPKDFDVATDARPEEVRALFRNCRLIGRRFRLAHVHFGREIIEVATFRGPATEEGEGALQDDSGMIVRDNVYGTLEEDAWRRDFTVNALYYNIADFSVVDYTGGLDDLHAGELRFIGDPWQRCREDPVRMLRAARFAAKLGFRLHAETAEAVRALSPLLAQVPPARLFEEVLKLFLSGHAVAAYDQLRQFHLFDHLFSQTEASVSVQAEGVPLTFVLRALGNTDARLAEGKPVTPAFLFAALLWEPLQLHARRYEADGVPKAEAVQLAADEVIAGQVARVAIPRRFTQPMREIWALQERLTRRAGRRAAQLIEQPRFRAGYDFLLLRAEAGEDVAELAQWWTDFQEADGTTKEALVRAPAATGEGEPERKRRRRRRRRRTAQPTPDA
ncbi:polynucleotide adenylyltransferase PcnB [Ectothiorhodospiraceae bacterium 2226]|nr:polynucleotide adenylyltransferase PcnB [Ectothiorhodospiraceae bacterium 2226]